MPEQNVDNAESVDNTSDDRIKNNTMRHAYRVLSDEEKAWMQEIKDLGQALHDKIIDIGRTSTIDGMSRELAIAATKTEEAVMWAVKHVTK